MEDTIYFFEEYLRRLYSIISLLVLYIKVE